MSCCGEAWTCTNDFSRMSREFSFKHEDTQLLLASTLLLIALAALAGWLAGPVFAVLVAIILAFFGVFGLLLNVYRARAEDDRLHQEHVQALFHLFATLNFRAPLPALTGWSVSPQLACTLIALVREREPEMIVEFGSGTSTLLLGYALEQQGRGRVVALDHLQAYASRTRDLVKRHVLSDWVDVRHAPLVETELGGERWQWYDLEAIEDESGIDMVFVDGPPHEIRSQARYPALPTLIDRMSEDAVIVLDDAYRADESSIAEAWSREFSGFDLEIQRSPYGTAVLRRSAS